MSGTSYNKHHAALAIEELYQQPSQHQQQNWLLTYLDVFVLIIMLVITLIALSELKTEQKNRKRDVSQTTIKTPAPLKKISSDIIVTKPPPSTKANNKLTKILHDPATPLPLIKQMQQPQAVEDKDKDKTLLSEEEIIKSEETKEADVKISQKNQQQNHQLSEETIQNQLSKTIENLGLTDAVDMKVTLGYAQLEIQDKILFKSSKATLLKEGAALLKKLTPLLDQSSGLIYIEGHTDNRPIKTAAFPSNWELGAARATSVLHYLASQKLNVSRLRAITYGDTKPVADNLTKAGREKNRRVSLVIKISDKID